MDLRSSVGMGQRLIMGAVVFLLLAGMATNQSFAQEVPDVPGCTNSLASNYNPLANVDDGSCIPMMTLCLDDGAINYNQEGECQYNAILDITYPESGDRLSGSENILSADFDDNDETVDEIEWAVYQGTCEAGRDVVVAGNIPGFNDSYELIDGQISMSLDVSNLLNGDYCFVVNPIEQAEETNIFESVNFIVDNHTQNVSGYKYEDINKNGVIDEGDTPVAGWTIFAFSSDNQWLMSAVTDNEGRYSFDLQSDTWVISEDERNDWVQVLADDNFDIEEIPSTEVVYTCTYTISDFRAKTRERGDYQCDFLNVQVERKSSSSGTKVKRPSLPEPKVLGAATSTTSSSASAGFCTNMYLSGYMRLGEAASSTEVLKLQAFLNAVGIKVALTGNFDLDTDAAVRTFQLRYLTDVLSPWGIDDATGYVYKTTRAKINNMLCPGSDPVPQL